MTIQGNHNVNPQPTPNTGGVGNQPQIGGAPVQQGGFGAIRRALSDIGHKVQDFFAGIATKFENWQEGRAIKQAERKANQAADALVAQITNPPLTPDSLEHIGALIKHSARVLPSDPEGYALNKMKDKVQEALPAAKWSEVQKLDFKGLSDTLKALSDKRIDQFVDMQGQLSKMMPDQKEPDGDALKTSANQRIDHSIDFLKKATGFSLESYYENVTGQSSAPGTFLRGNSPHLLAIKDRFGDLGQDFAQKTVSLIGNESIGFTPKDFEVTDPNNPNNKVPMDPSEKKAKVDSSVLMFTQALEYLVGSDKQGAIGKGNGMTQEMKDLVATAFQAIDDHKGVPNDKKDDFKKLIASDTLLRGLGRQLGDLHASPNLSAGQKKSLANFQVALQLLVNHLGTDKLDPDVAKALGGVWSGYQQNLLTMFQTSGAQGKAYSPS